MIEKNIHNGHQLCFYRSYMLIPYLFDPFITEHFFNGILVYPKCLRIRKNFNTPTISRYNHFVVVYVQFVTATKIREFLIFVVDEHFVTRPRFTFCFTSLSMDKPFLRQMTVFFLFLSIVKSF